MAVAEVRDLTKRYVMGTVEVHALRGMSLAIEEGEFITIMGASGSGKSTLLSILGCLARPTSGQYLLGGEDVSTYTDNALSEVRCRRIGFIFQSYNLIPQLTVLENIEVPLYYQGQSERDSRDRAEEMAVTVGLRDRLTHRPYELSGGQQQRVAIARALAANPLFLLADEPTGNLDSATGAEILELLKGLHAEGRTLVVVTHDFEVAQLAQRMIVLADGQVESIVAR